VTQCATDALDAHGSPLARSRPIGFAAENVPQIETVAGGDGDGTGQGPISISLSKRAASIISGLTPRSRSPAD
jgi:hypothetical protein